jgi:hypothetical protein
MLLKKATRSSTHRACELIALAASATGCYCYFRLLAANRATSFISEVRGETNHGHFRPEPPYKSSRCVTSRHNTTRTKTEREGRLNTSKTPSLVTRPLCVSLRRGAVMESFELGIQTTGFTSSKPKLHAKFANGWGGKHSIDAAIFSSS